MQADHPATKPPVTLSPVNSHDAGEMLREALTGKSRLFVLRLEADMTATLTHPGARLPLPRFEGSQRLFAHKAAALCGFVHTIEHTEVPRTIVLVHPGGAASTAPFRALVVAAAAAAATAAATAADGAGCDVAGPVAAPVRVVMLRRGGAAGGDAGAKSIAAPTPGTAHQPAAPRVEGADPETAPLSDADRAQAEQDARCACTEIFACVVSHCVLCFVFYDT
jgi:hypothetical protein